MAIMRKTLKSLLPTGDPWRLAPSMRALIDALSASLERAHDFIAAVVTENNSGTSVSTLSRWYGQLGIEYDSTQELGDLQYTIQSRYISIGGQSLQNIRDVVQRVYSRINIDIARYKKDNVTGFALTGKAVTSSYPSWYSGDETGELPFSHYHVYGDVEKINDRDGLISLLERIGPAEMEPSLFVEIDELSTVAVVGRSQTGYSVTGFTPSDDFCNTGYGETGIAITGKGVQDA